MPKRARSAPEDSFNDWFFNITPDSGEREIQGFFIPSVEDKTQSLVNRLVNIASGSKPVDDAHTLTIDADPETVSGFTANNVVDSDYRLMIKLVDFKAVNSPINISPEQSNNKFWLWENWDGSPNVVPSSTLWQGNIVEYKIPTGYYPEQEDLFSIIKKVSGDKVTFTLDATNLVTYTGDKPLILPLSPNFDPSYYKARTQVNVVDSVGSVPGNISGLITDGSPSEFIISSSVNSLGIPMNVANPPYGLDYLAVKLGFTSTGTDSKSLFRPYFGYPQVSNFPNTSSSATALTFLQNKEMSIAIVVYPLCKANTFGYMYGAMSNLNIVSPNIDSKNADQNILGKISVAQYSTYSSFQYDVGTWLPLSSASGMNKYFKFQLLDDYNRPYRFATGTPFIKVAIALRKNT